MSATNLGNQTLAFDFRHPLKGSDFNILLRGLFPPGIYAGGTLTNVGNLVSIAAFTAVLNTGTDKAVKIATTSAVTVTVTEAEPVIYMTFTWADEVENWIDFDIRATGSSVTNEVVFGQATFTGGDCTGFSYTDRTIGIVYDDELQAATEEVQALLTAHTANVSNPHSVTKTQVGLGSVDNYSSATSGTIANTYARRDANGNCQLRVPTSAPGAEILGNGDIWVE